jgi:hypothetical protein
MHNEQDIQEIREVAKQFDQGLLTLWEYVRFCMSKGYEAVSETELLHVTFDYDPELSPEEQKALRESLTIRV